MNSFVSVEDDDVQCDDLDSLVLSATSLFGTELLSKSANDGNLVINSEDLDSPHIDTVVDDFVCVTGNSLGTNTIKTRSKAKQKSLKDSKGTNTFQQPKVHPEIEIDGKLISLDIGEGYENLNSLDIECLPFETVLMNYPGQVDYFDLNDKYLNISGSPNPFDSDQESESFDGFSENSNSSFEGFNDCKPSSQIHPLTQKSSSKSKREKSPKLSHSSEEQKGYRKLDCNYNSDTHLLSAHKGLVSPVFGDQRVTPLLSKAEDFINTAKLDFNLDSTPLRPSLSQSRPTSFRDNKLPKSRQNYSKGITSPFCYSTTTKFKEKANESGSMQQKSKKERLIPQGYKNNTHKRNISTEIEGESVLAYEDIFSDDSDLDITFEGFQGNFENLPIEIKNEPNDIEEFIGINCDKIGCTISWLESKQAKNVPELINNGIVFELSEFAKKIAWEPNYIAEWICRLKGYLDINISNEDMRKINIVLKRRKALMVNFAGKYSLKSKLANFDTELFTLPSIENLEAVKRNKSVLKDDSDYFNEKAPIKESKTEDTNILSSETESELKHVDNDLQKTANYKDLDENKDLDGDTEMLDHSDIDSLFENSDLEVSDKDISDNEGYMDIKVSLESRISGRVRKPTAKAQESYSIKYFGSSTPPQNGSPLRSIQNISPRNQKILHPIFNDDGKDIGPHCKVAHIDIKLLNSIKEASFPITKGVVYELYHFFRERKASLTSLVHTLYRLKNIPFDKSQIIATMAKIHEMVKVMWKENIDKDKNMPFEEVNLVDFESSERTKAESPAKTNIAIKQKTNEIISEHLCKRRKHSSSIESLSGKEDSNSELSTESMKDNSNKSFDLNSTKGFVGKLTRGDIVYLYTKWLKKKMEGQSNVFVTDLSKDVEDLIIERKVECIRIPVGTLMSSSVKLFEEFRKLSKVNMFDAKTYLLEDWIDDIKCILKSTGKKPEGNQDSNITKVSNANVKYKTKDQNLPEESISSSTENITEPKILSSTKKSITSCVSNDYEVEKIVGYRIVKIGEESVTEYRIRWSGFSSKDDSWINEADLNCPEILAKFWEALNKQRALKNKTDSLANENCNVKQSVRDSPIKPQQICFDDSSLRVDETVNQPPECNMVSIIPSVQNDTISQVNQSKVPLTIGQKNISSFFGKENQISQTFFNIMVNGLKPDLVDYQHEEESSFSKRIKITKGEVLTVYDRWRLQNQEHELKGGNKKIDVNVLISMVKDLVASKKVRNFNPTSILDACYRMSLMKAKLKDSNKIEEYLSGDFIELMQMSQKHQDFVRSENTEKLKKIKQGRSNGLNENDKLNTKINNINNLERESLIIARYLDTNKNKNIEKDLERNIFILKKKLGKEQIEENIIENIKKENLSVIKELELYGVVDSTLDEILNIASKIKI